MDWKEFVKMFTYGDEKANEVVERLVKAVSPKDLDAIVEYAYDKGYEDGREDGYDEGYYNGNCDARESEDW